MEAVKIIIYIIALLVPFAVIFISINANLKLKYAPTEAGAKLSISDMTVNVITFIGLILCISMFFIELLSEQPLTRYSVFKMILPFVNAIVLLFLKFAWTVLFKISTFVNMVEAGLKASEGKL